MTSPGRPGLSDDWDRHWSSFGDAVAGNPATAYRTRLILWKLGTIPEGSVIVEIGCGQGELALHLAEQNPRSAVVGIDASAEGVRRASAAAEASGLSARFARRDLTEPVEVPDDDRRSATLAVCSEVLEHVDDPRQFLIHASEYLAPGSRLVVTVPGGPRSTFDRHIGHRRHFSAARLRQLLEASGFDQVRVDRAGFPFFNLYRLVVIARGKHLIADVEESDDSGLETGAAGAALRFFERAFRYNLDSSPFGWQLVADARFSPGSAG